MAAIWNWSIEAYNVNERDIANVIFDTQAIDNPGASVFAFTYLTKLLSHPNKQFPDATPVAEAYLRGYWYWDQNGNEQYYDFAGTDVKNPNSWFITNCSRARVCLAVRSVEAKSNITFIEFG